MKNILLSVNGLGVIIKNNFSKPSPKETVYPWKLSQNRRAPLAANWDIKYVTYEIWEANRAWRFLQSLSERDDHSLVEMQTQTRTERVDWIGPLKSYRVNDESMCHKWYCIIELVDTDKCILFWSDSNRINIFEYSFQNIKILANSILIIICIS